jgi:hypothetical protein
MGRSPGQLIRRHNFEKKMPAAPRFWDSAYGLVSSKKGRLIAVKAVKCCLVSCFNRTSFPAHPADARENENDE